MKMKDYLEIPLSELKGVTYTNPDRKIDNLERSFLEFVSSVTKFPADKIHLSEVKKMRYSRNFDYFAFEYEGVNYILEKNQLKKA